MWCVCRSVCLLCSAGQTTTSSRPSSCSQDTQWRWVRLARQVHSGSGHACFYLPHVHVDTHAVTEQKTCCVLAHSTRSNGLLIWTADLMHPRLLSAAAADADAVPTHHPPPLPTGACAGAAESGAISRQEGWNLLPEAAAARADEEGVMAGAVCVFFNSCRCCHTYEVRRTYEEGLNVRCWVCPTLAAARVHMCSSSHSRCYQPPNDNTACIYMQQNVDILLLFAWRGSFSCSQCTPLHHCHVWCLLGCLELYQTSVD